MEVSIEWKVIQADSPMWTWSRVLYAYVHKRKVYYVGKAEKTTVFQRFHAKDKDSFFNWVKEEHGLSPEDFEVLIGVPRAEPGRKVTHVVLRDLEALLIFETKPLGNIKGKNGSIVRRPEMHAVCVGDWCVRRRRFKNPCF